MDGSMTRLGDVVTPIIDRLAVRAAPETSPRFYAEGRVVVASASGYRRTPTAAREYLKVIVEDAVAVNDDMRAEADLMMISDLVRAIRAADRNDPTPPAAIARAA